MRTLLSVEGEDRVPGLGGHRRGWSPKGHDVVVIVPAHNEAEQIRGTIRSLKRQTHAPALIVVSADNCTDDTAAIAREEGAEVHVTIDNTARKAGALNQAWLRHAKGFTHVLTMDADTVLAEDAIERMLEAFDLPRGSRAGRPLGATCARYWAKDGSGLAWRLQRLEYARYDDAREMRGWECQVASGAASLYSASALEDVVAHFGRTVPWDPDSLIEDYALTLDLKTLGYVVRAARGAQVLTDTPKTFGELWTQRMRWGRGGVDECRQRGWTTATRRDIAAYGLFFASTSMRLIWLAYIITLFSLGLGLSFAIVGMVPLVLMWVDRVTSAWRVPDRTWQDVVIAVTMVAEDLYGMFLEACTAVAIFHSFRRTRQAW